MYSDVDLQQPGGGRAGLNKLPSLKYEMGLVAGAERAPSGIGLVVSYSRWDFFFSAARDGDGLTTTANDWCDFG